MIIYSPWIIVVGLVLDLAIFAIHRLTGLKIISGISFTFLFFDFWLMGLFFMRQRTGGISRRKPSPELLETFNDLLRKFGIENIELVLCKSSQVNGLLFRNRCLVTERSLDTLSEAGVEFIIAHELAHAKFFRYRPEQMKVPKWLAYVFVATALIGLLSLRLQLPWYVYGLCLAPLLVTLIYLFKNFPTTQSSMGPDMELACDYLALTMVAELNAGLEVMNALKHGSRADRALGGHPSKERRIEQINDYLMGHPRRSYKNAFVERGVESFLDELRNVVS